MNERVPVLILKQSDYREADILMQCLSADYGRFSVRARGARKLTSRNASSLLPYTEAELELDMKQGGTLFRLKSARTLNFYRHLHEDLVLSSAASVLTDAMSAMTMEGRNEESREQYALLKNSLDALETGHHRDTVLALYLAEILNMFGSGPDVDECTVCGKKKVSALSVRAGGFLCKEDAEEAGVPLSSADDLKRFRLLCRAGMKHLEEIEKIAPAEFADVEILAEFMRAYTGVNLASFAFYRDVVKLSSSPAVSREP